MEQLTEHGQVLIVKFKTPYKSTYWHPVEDEMAANGINTIEDYIPRAVMRDLSLNPAAELDCVQLITTHKRPRAKKPRARLGQPNGHP